jgi:hypothetical protein
MPETERPPRHVRIDLPIEGADDLRLLRGALLAAKAAELAEIKRRDLRQFAGYGTDSAREGMTDEMTHARRRMELLDRLLAALESARDPEASAGS